MIAERKFWTKKAFNTKEDAENFIKEKFEDKVDIDVYWPTNPYIDAQVTVYLNIWEDEDGEVGGYDTIQHMLRIIEIELA